MSTLEAFIKSMRIIRIIMDENKNVTKLCKRTYLPSRIFGRSFSIEDILNEYGEIIPYDESNNSVQPSRHSENYEIHDERSPEDIESHTNARFDKGAAQQLTEHMEEMSEDIK
jgi:hypothetical protein